MNNKEVLQIALQQSAYDCNCEPQDFMVVENRFFESVDTNQARRYLQLPHICNMFPTEVILWLRRRKNFFQKLGNT